MEKKLLREHHMEREKERELAREKEREKLLALV